MKEDATGHVAVPAAETAHTQVAPSITLQESGSRVQDALEQDPWAAKKTEHRGGTRLISEADLVSLGGGRPRETRTNFGDVSSRTASVSSSSKPAGSFFLTFLASIGLLGFAVLGKASSGEETYQEGGVSPFMTQLDYGSEGSPSSITVLLSKIGVDRLSSLDFENLNSDRLANKNGSLNKEDFANNKIGTSYSDLVNTVGIPSSVSWSSMMGSESFLIFYYKLSDTRFVTIHFGGNRTISEINGLEDPATSASTTP